MNGLALLTRYGLTRQPEPAPPTGGMALYTWPTNPAITAHTLGTTGGPTTNQVGARYTLAAATKIGAVWIQMNGTAQGTVRLWRASDMALLAEKHTGPTPIPKRADGLWVVIDLDEPVDVAAAEEIVVTYQNDTTLGMRLLSAATRQAGVTHVGNVNHSGTGFPSTGTPNDFAIAFDMAATWSHAAAGNPSSVDALVVGGGGRGGAGVGGGGGGGGAGRVRVESALSVSGDVFVFVGSGHVADMAAGASQFGAVVAEGGGAGGGKFGYSNAAGYDGGSGGGAGYSVSGTLAGGASVGPIGNVGGASTDPTGSTTRRAAGGGGGAGAPGGEPVVVGTARRGGDGGDGVTLASLGWEALEALGAPSTFAAGGGGGAASDAAGSGAGGAGGGGNGSRATTATDATPDTGSGGGGGNAQSGLGATGFVAVRW